MKSDDILRVLEEGIYFGRSYLRFRELRPSVGYKHDERRIDLWVIECAPSKGMPAHAIEVKVSRSDWLRELKNPKKRRQAMALSNYYWIAAPVGVVDIVELPSQVGLIEIDPGKVGTKWYQGSVVHRADYRDKVRPTWGLLASLLRRQV